MLEAKRLEHQCHLAFRRFNDLFDIALQLGRLQVGRVNHD